MYTKVIPHKNFRGKTRNQEVNFNLTTHEVLKLLVEFKSIFDWQEAVEKRDPEAEPPTEEVIEFYTNFEEILLSAWGELDESGDHFFKGGRYEFKESSVFHAAMDLFLKDPSEVTKLVDGLMPEGLQDLVKASEANLAALAEQAKKDGDTMSPGLKRTVEDLERELAEARANQTPPSES
jgi:hypothetical protein